MEARFRTRMDRSLDEIAAEMHSEQSRDAFAQVYEKRAFLGAEPSFQRSSSSKRYAPYPDVGSSGHSLGREGDCKSPVCPGSPSGDGGVGGSRERNAKVFVGNLSYSTSWQALKEHMRRAGPVLKCDVFSDSSGKSKGMGLVQYESADSAERALVELQDTVLNGRRLFVRKHMDPVDRGKAGMSTRRTNPVKLPSNPAATVFVQNLDYSVTWQKLKDVLKVAGRIVNVDLARDRDGKSKGHATVQFSEPSEAINAIALFHSQMLCDRPMKLRMDSSSPYQPDPIQLRLSGGSPYQPNPMQMRLSGLAGGATPTLPVPPPPPPPPMPPQRVLPPAALAASLGEATPTNPLSVPLLTSVITSLAAEKLAATLIQNGALGSSGAPGLLQQQLFTPPPLPHPSVPQLPTSRYRAERFSHSSGSRGSPAELSPGRRSRPGVSYS